MSENRRSWLSCVKKQYGAQGSLRRALVSGSAGTVAVKAAGGAFAFALSVLLARLLSPSGFGVYSLALSVVSIISVPAQFGLPQLVVRETSRALEMQLWSLMKGIWLWSHAAALFSGVLLAIALGWLTYTNVLGWDREFRNALLASSPLIILLALANIRGAALRGLRFAVLGLLPEFVFRPALFVLFLILLALLNEGDHGAQSISPVAASFTHVAASFAAFLTGGLILLKHTPSKVTRSIPATYEHSKWLASALPLAAGTGMQVIILQIDTVFVGVFHESSDVGTYRVVAAGAAFLSFVLTSVNMVVAPYLAALFAKSDWDRLRKVVKLSSRVVAAASLPMVLMLAIWSAELISSIYGDEYASGVAALRIMLIGQAINIVTGPAGTLLNMTGNERAFARGVYVSFIANLVIGLILIPRYGVEGAAATTAITIAISNGFQYMAVRKRFGYGCSPF